MHVKYKQIFFLFFYSFWISTTAQELNGVWRGNLQTSTIELPLIFKISTQKDGLKGTLVSPKQSKTALAAMVKVFKTDSILVTVKGFGIKYRGKVEDTVINGVFKQSGNSIPLRLVKKSSSNDHKIKIGRIQDPKTPHPYISEEVEFTNFRADSIKLSGTLTLPKNSKKPPVVILISGSGPQDRNEEILNHRPFLVLSDYLTRKGIAVLRYDDRGVAESEGTFKGATTHDFASDVEAAILFLENRTDFEFNKLGLIGHSEGGLIAPMIASKNKNVDFIVLMAGPGISGKEVLTSQTRQAMKLAGAAKPFRAAYEQLMEIILTEVKNGKDPSQSMINAEEKLAQYYNALDQNLKDQIPLNGFKAEMAKFANDPWMVNFVKAEPEQFLSKIKVPVLAVNGAKDFQVMSNLNLPEIEKALKKAGNDDYTVKELEGLNHLFQKAETGGISEYGVIEETLNEKVLQLISEWILERFH